MTKAKPRKRRDQDFLVQASVTCAQMTTETLTVNVLIMPDMKTPE